MSDGDPGSLFVFGLGYSAERLGRALLARGWRVAGTTREEVRAAELREAGFEVHRFDRDRPLADPTSILAGTTHLLSSVPPDAIGDPVLDRHGPDLVRLDGVTWAGYLSTTGVYGDRGGGWVDETSPLEPTGERGRRRAAAEAAWLGLGLPMHVFRLAGIYGPGRSALDTVRAGRAKRVHKPGQVFSRIHVDDIVAVLLASIAQPNPGTAYNVCDDEPAPPAEVIEHACRLLGVDPPPLVPLDEAELGPMARSFWADSKRVSNRRIREELGVTLAYPTYREGLGALAAA